MPFSATGGRAPRRTIFTAASLIGLMATAPALAQDASEARDAEAEAIVITGSRIQLSPGMTTPVPVTAVTASEVKQMAPNTIVDGLSTLPQFYGNSTQSGNNFFGSGSTGSLNLRGLGANRTLVLLNGRRMPSATAFGGVDITNFPEALISSIQTVTGGASAAYGTDAVAGVTNFLLDTRFSGLKATFQGGSTTRGDGGNYTVSATFGMKVGDRGHFVVSAEMFEQEGIHSYAGRDWYQGWSTVPDAAGNLYIYPNVVSRNASYNGIIAAAPTSPLYGLMFNKDGTVSSFQNGSVLSGNIGSNGSARQAGGSNTDLNLEVNTIQPDFTRSNIFAYGDYELTDGLKLFAQYIRGRKTTSSFNNPRGAITGAPTNITIFRDNAFLPQSVVNIMTQNNIQSFSLRRMGSIYDIGGNYKISDETVLNTGTVGLDWDIHSGGFMDNWRVEAYYQYGHSVRNAYQTGLRVDRIYAAADAVKDANGNIVCRVSTTAAGAAAFPGCRPINLFGAGNASAASVDYVTGYDPGQQINTQLYFAGQGLTGATDSYVSQDAKVNITKLEQHVAELSASGELYKGWAGPITMALGASYRKESIYQIVRDPGNKTSDHTLGALQTAFPCLSATAAAAAGLRGQPGGGDCANTVFTQFSKVSNLDASIDVKEAFGEILVPLLADVTMFKRLSLDLSARYADYSGSGGVWAYKGGLDWTLIDGLRLRGTYSRDVRAGNLSERFDVTGGTATVNDKFFATPQQPNGPSVTVTRFSGGNPAVKPEKADTVTAGAVFQPTFIPNLSVSVDWYRIKMTDAISQLGVQAVVNGCVDGNTTLCALVTRDATNNLVLVGDQYVNVDRAVISGVDLEASYQHRISLIGGGAESVSGRLFSSWLIENSQRLGSVYKDRAGQTGIQASDGIAYLLPRYKMTSSLTYRNGGFSLFTQGRYIGAGYNEIGNAQITHNRVSSVYYVDLRIGNSFKFAGGRTLEAFINITNLLDKSPPLTPYWSAFTHSTTQTNAGLFDILGRRFVIGAKFSL